MSFLQQLWLRLTPPVQTSAPDISVDCESLDRPGVTAVGEKALPRDCAPKPEVKLFASSLVARGIPKLKPFYVSQWFLNDILFIAMLSMAFAGVIFRLPVIYWIILTPVFGLISIAEGWSHFHTRGEQLGLAYRVAAISMLLLLPILGLTLGPYALIGLALVIIAMLQRNLQLCIWALVFGVVGGLEHLFLISNRLYSLADTLGINRSKDGYFSWSSSLVFGILGVTLILGGLLARHAERGSNG